MILPKNLFPFNSAREENRVQHAEIICSCSHHSSTAWHPRLLARSPSAAAGSPPVVSDALLHPPPAHAESPQGRCRYPMNGSNASVSQLYIPGTTAREGFLFTGLPLCSPDQRQPITSIKPRGQEQCFFPAPTGVEIWVWGRNPTTTPECDLCNFY